MQVENQIRHMRPILAMLPPLVAFVLQWSVWPILDPFAWFLFYPAVFFSSWIGGLAAGLTATAVSTVLVWLWFIPPQFVLLKDTPGAYLSAFVFMAMGVVFSLLHKRLRRAMRQSVQALRLAHQANDRLHEANDKITRLYEQSRELDEIKSQFFANVSHELHTPLTLILGPVGKRLASENIGEEERRDLEVVERNARLLHWHINDLLDVAKLEAERMQMQYVQVDLAGLTRFVASHFESLAGEKGIRYVIEVPDVLSAQADAEKYQRIVLNLLSNAFKFTPDGGTVALSLGVESGRAILHVRDSGPGTRESLREGIFERFRQVEGGAERRYGGTGLGLAIVKEFVELHGGAVEVTDASGGGALFNVALPLAAPEGSEIQTVCAVPDEALHRQVVDELRVQPVPAAFRPPDAGEEAPLVLVVEDNPDMNAFLTRALGQRYRVVAAFDGQEGLNKALEAHPDLIVCDVMMPRMSGDQMVGELRRHPEMGNVPIVMLTAKADDALRLDLLRDQVQDYVQKPFGVEELLARAHKLVVGRMLERTRFETVVESSPNGILLMDGEGRITLVNAALERIFGYRRDELLGLSVERLVPERFQEAHAGYRGDFFAHHPEGRSMGAGRDLYGRCKDGREIPVEIGLTPLETGQGPMVLATIIDITIRKKTEAALRESEANLRHAQAITHMGSWRLDIPTGAMAWSEETYRIFGIPQGTPVDQDTFLSCAYPDDRERIKAAWKATLACMPYNIEHRILAGKEEKWVCERAEVTLDAFGQPSVAFGAVQDITAQKVMEQCLQEATRRKDEFLAMLAHELRNPLAPIRNAVEIMRAIGPREPRLDWARDVVDRQVTQLTRLVDELLEVSRITRGKVTLIIKTLDLVDVVNQAVELSRPLIDGRKHTLSTQFPPLPVWIRGDLTRLTQVVTNLLDNAAKYTPKGGHIALKVATEDREAVITVADTGNGISPELLPHLFEPFTQGERSLARAEGGLGLGLTLVKNLVDLHGGRVAASSPGVGYGAEFQVRLPCLTAGEGRDASGTRAVESAPLIGERVLLVDDNLDVLNSLAFLFKLKGYEVKTAADGPAALKLAEAFHPRVIVLDIGLPGMDGYEVCTQIRAQHPEPSPLIIALTGYGEKKDYERARAVGFDHHLVKPADPEQLFALIDANQPLDGARNGE